MNVSLISGTVASTKAAAAVSKNTTNSKATKMDVLQKTDSAISTPYTCSVGGTGTASPLQQIANSNNNTNNSSCVIGSPATPTQHQSGIPAAPPTPGSGTIGSSGHKNSLKGTKLARRARSFKDDIISLMRTTNNTLGRSHSPHSPRNKNASATKPPPTAEEVAKSTQTLETHVKDISNALKHFRDVILKKKLEVLPGNGTVILETIASLYSVIQSYTLSEHSTVLLSATQQVYQSLGKLIKLCDEVMLSEDSGDCASLSNENVREVVDLLEAAVRNLVTLAQQKLKEKEDCTFRYSPGVGLGIATNAITSGSDVSTLYGSGVINSNTMPAGTTGSGGITAQNNHLMRPPVEVAGQRTSLPDITLTPKERDILEKTKSNPIRISHSTESILRDTSPPPKPPLPNRTNNPPPLPPKRRSQQQQNPNQLHSNNNSINSDLDLSSDFSLMNYGVDHLSVRSRSPDENSSQCSLDSALNHSRDEEELKTIQTDCVHRFDDSIMDDEEKLFACKNIATSKGTIAVGKSLIQQQQQQQQQKQQQQQQQQRQCDKDKDEAIVSNSSEGATGGGDSISGLNKNGIGVNSVGGMSVLSASIQNVAAVTAKTVMMAAVAAVANNAAATAVVNDSEKTTDATMSASAATAATASTSVAVASGIDGNETEMRAASTANNNRLSNESGFVSMTSFRTSTQSVSKRSSDYSFQSSTKSSSSNSELAFGLHEISSTTSTSLVTVATTTSSNTSGEYHHQYQQHKQQQEIATTTTSGTSSSSTTTSASSQQQQSVKIMCSTDVSNDAAGNATTADDSIDTSDEQLSEPPALPPKQQRQSGNAKSPTTYNDELDDSAHELPELRHHNAFTAQQRNLQQQYVYQWQSKYQSLIEPRTNNLAGSCVTISGGEPPPLPIKKKKNILAYMEICTPTTHCIEQHRHTMHTYNTNRNMSYSQTMNIVSLTKELSPERETPPALPPKNYKPRNSKPTITPPTIITTPPPSPKPTHLNGADACTDMCGVGQRQLMSTLCEELGTDDTHNDEATGGFAIDQTQKGNTVAANDEVVHYQSHQLPNEMDDNNQRSPQLRRYGSQNSHNQYNEANAGDGSVTEDDDYGGIDVALEQNDDTADDPQLPNMLEEIDITPYLVLKKEHEDGPEVKGGYIDALIVHASRVQRNSDNAFSEAFITTFRTFIQPIDVIEKLTHRYTVFFCQLNDQKQKAAKETFSLLVRVVNDLTSTDLTSQLMTLIVEFVYQLVCSGQLYLAKLLRNKFVEKVTLYKEQKAPIYSVENCMHKTVINQPSLLDLKSVEIAEQMTLLDAELFQKIEIPEVLLFAKEQCEEKSPNLNKFTEHFNKMSYWARSKILTLHDAKEREKYVIKFIKIMKHLRKMNNYNSYLALLSALDSAPIRRLEWHKTITEGLKEYCTLIDSSSSFRVYRLALAETNPPCIPYIGLVLQDLTFVHVGNQDYLSKGVINFSKRWQQYNIIDNMKRFKKCSYTFRRNERIIRFFENFENFLGEEDMWQISETIKPRGRRPVNY